MKELLEMNRNVCVCEREAIITNEKLIHISHCRSD